MNGDQKEVTRNEIEIKLPAADLADLGRKLNVLGFRILVPRFHELNLVFDTPRGDLRRNGRLLRLRSAGGRVILTAKAPPPPGGNHNGYKVRRETETDLSDFDAGRKIFEGSGFVVVFTYEKFREIMERNGVKVMLDETPVGDFLEIEGTPEAIDDLAADLGFRRDDYITANYRSLYRASGKTGDMRFQTVPNESPEG